MKILKKIKLKRLIKRGLEIGKCVKIEKGVIIDSGFPYLISIGNNVTFAPYSHILGHDASTKPFLNYTKIGKVSIGDNVFVGAKAIILPNINIGNNVIIGAGSIVTKDIPDNSVVCGNPATVISSLDTYLEKNKEKMNAKNMFGEEYLIKNIDPKGKQEVQKAINEYGISYIL